MEPCKGGGSFKVTRFEFVVVGAAAFLGLTGSVLAQDSSCKITEIAPGVKMRAANCPTLIGRPAAMTQNRVDSALQQPPAGLYRYSDVEMRITGPRTQTTVPLGGSLGVIQGQPRRP